MNAIKEAVLALVAGAILGFLFGKLRLPAPAPLSAAGILGIIGIAIGYALARR